MKLIDFLRPASNSAQY